MAVMHLYSYYSPHFLFDEVEAPRLTEFSTHDVIPESHPGYKVSTRILRQHCTKRACRWRSILLSGLGETVYPYSQFIRTLDLQDLGKLLTHPKSRDIASE